MLNLIRMNLFRLTHTKGVIVIFVLLMGVSVLNACVSAVESEEAMEWYRKDVRKETGNGEAVPDMAGTGADAGDGAGADETGGKEEMQGSSDGAGTGGMEEMQGSGDGAETGGMEEMQGSGDGAGAGGKEEMQGSSDGAETGGMEEMQGSGDGAETGGMEEMQGSGDGVGTDVPRMDEDIEGIGEDIEGDNLVYDIGYEIGQKGGSMGIYLETPLNGDGGLQDYLMLYGAELSSGIVLLFLLLAAIIFFWGDERDGFVKNIAGQTKHKAGIFLSKLIAIGIFTLVSMLCYMVLEFASFKCSLLLGVDIRFGMEHWKEACKVFATQYLLYMAFISGLLLLTEVTRSTAVSITIGLLGLLGFGVVVSAMVQKIFHTDFQMVKYYVNTSITAVNMYVGWDVFRLALCVGGISFVVYNVLHLVWFVRRDIV